MEPRHKLERIGEMQMSEPDLDATPETVGVPPVVAQEESTPEETTLSDGETAQLNQIEAYLYSIDRTLDSIETLLTAIKEAANSHTTSLDWLTTNTAGLFNGFQQMQDAGGISALLPSLMGGKKNG
jgi:hypothetical protein